MTNSPFPSPTDPPRTFAEEVEFLRRHTDGVVVLGADAGKPRVAVVGEYQARVMVSTAGGDAGGCHGWINHELIASGARTPQINAFGGEDRFWLGPEGGQFSIFFPPGTDYTFAQWQTPAAIDSEAYALVEADANAARFSHEARLTNVSGTVFDVGISREIVLLGAEGIAGAIGVPLSGAVNAVGFESRNAITNTGGAAWTRESGLLSIWIPGMFRPGAQTTVVIPFRPGPEERLGPVVNGAYFGQIPAERLVVREGRMFFRADAQHRGKLGLGPARGLGVAGSWAPEPGMLTIVQHSLPEVPTAAYVNSMWHHQDEPFAGDVINSYNDGPTTPGGEAIGGFYEIETSSPALALRPGETGSHVHRTMHFAGERAALDAIARRVLGAGLDEIELVFRGG
ncbi:MAG: DUF6786 family protein [Phycisphaerales bacterium JB054]